MARTVRLALCSLEAKNEQWIRIVLPRAQTPGLSFQAVSGSPYGTCEVALVDCESADSMAAHGEVRRGNGGLLTLWISTEGELGGEGGVRLPRRALMFRLAAVLAELMAAHPTLGVPSPGGVSHQPRLGPGAPVGPTFREGSGIGSLASGGDRRLTALVVDDSLTVRTQLSAVLERIGLRVLLAAAAEEAEQILLRQSCDILFLDVVLPGRDGYAICKALRKNPSTSDLMILMLTSRSAPFDRARGALAGCDLYLTKPVQLKEVYEAVDRAVMKAFKQDRAAVLSRGYKPQLA